jgi:hypothetical protein
MGRIVEFGPSGRQRPIVPAEEREKAIRDAEYYGIGYLHDERRLDPNKIEIVFPEDAPATLVAATREWLTTRLAQGQN